MCPGRLRPQPPAECLAEPSVRTRALLLSSVGLFSRNPVQVNGVYLKSSTVRAWRGMLSRPAVVAPEVARFCYCQEKGVNTTYFGKLG